MAESNARTHLYSLPNEILVQILTPFTTQTLLPLTAVSHRFHAIVLRILHYRLLLAASLKEYKLMLECFHPSSKLTDPHSFCSYLGTPGLSNNHEGEGSLYENCETAERLGRLSSVYSRFRPESGAAEQSPWRPRNRLQPPTGINVEIESNVPAEDASSQNEGLREILLVKKHISLDEFEDFSQLCTVVNLVKVIPNSTLLVSAVTVEDGIIRIWRDWLKKQAKVNHRSLVDAGDSNDERVLWVDNKRNVGLKLRVKEKRWNRQVPVLMHRDEELAVSYEVEIEEVRIRTTRLLLTVEQSLAEQQNYPKAVIIGAIHALTSVT